MNDFDIGEGHGAWGGMAAVGEAMREVSAVDEHVGDVVGDHGGTEGQVAAGEPFREACEVRVEIPQVARKPRAEAAKRRAVI